MEVPGWLWAATIIVLIGVIAIDLSWSTADRIRSGPRRPSDG